MGRRAHLAFMLRLGLVGLTVVGSGCDSALSLLAPEEPAPAAPLLAPVESPTQLETVRVTGTKQASTGVLVGERTVVPLDELTTFSFWLELAEGEQTFEVRTVDGRGVRSGPAPLTVERDRTGPAAPTVDPTPSYTEATSLALSGTKEAGSALWLDGQEAVAASPSTTWAVTVALREGDNRLRLAAQDALGNESDVVTVRVIRTAGGFTLDPVPALTHLSPLPLTGVRGAAVRLLVDGVEVLPVGPAGPFTAWAEVVEGENTLTVTGERGQESWEATVSVTIDLVAPAAPVVDPLPPVSLGPAATLTGSLPEAAGLAIGGEVLVASLPAGAFSVSLPLAPGVNELQVAAIDAAGNLSAATAVATYQNPAGLVFEVDALATTALEAPLFVSGVRGGEVAVYLDGALVLPGDGGGGFSLDVPLAPGPNSFVLEGRAGPASRTVAIDVEFVEEPAPPVLDAVDWAAVAGVASVTGTRPPGTAVVRSGVVVVAAGPDPAFVDDVAVPPGVTDLAYQTQDAWGRRSLPVAATVTWDTDAGVVDGGSPDGGPAGGGDGGG